MVCDKYINTHTHTYTHPLHFRMLHNFHKALIWDMILFWFFLVLVLTNFLILEFLIGKFWQQNDHNSVAAKTKTKMRSVQTLNKNKVQCVTCSKWTVTAYSSPLRWCLVTHRLDRLQDRFSSSSGSEQRLCEYKAIPMLVLVTISDCVYLKLKFIWW